MNSESSPGKKNIIKKYNPSSPSPSSSSTLLIQNRFTPLLPSISSTPRPRPRPSYSALAQLQNIPVSPLTPPRSLSTSSTPPLNKNTGSNLQKIKILEPLEEEKLRQGFSNLLDYIFPKGAHFYKNEYQTREYYEAVLVETKSIEVTHHQASNGYIEYSKVKILQIITPEEWSSRPFINKTLSTYPIYPAYNYYDYQEAWFNFFLLRSFNHSWFIYFANTFASDYPRWFLQWFQYMGAIPEIFPSKVLEGFNQYKIYFAYPGTPLFEYVLQFLIIFQIPWIVSFTYKKEEGQGTSPPILYRQYRFKWWNKIDEKNADIVAVTTYYKEVSKSTAQPSPSSSTSTLQDAEYIKRIQSCTSPEDIQKILNEVKHSPPPTENLDLFQDSQDPFGDISL